MVTAQFALGRVHICMRMCLHFCSYIKSRIQLSCKRSKLVFSIKGRCWVAMVVNDRDNFYTARYVCNCTHSVMFCISCLNNIMYDYSPESIILDALEKTFFIYIANCQLQTQFLMIDLINPHITTKQGNKYRPKSASRPYLYAYITRLLLICITPIKIY